jgi:hypothetical protein
MKNIDYSNHIQKEAILNECKGNLFEFLVTQNLAAKSSLEAPFLMNLPMEYKIQLKRYEELIRQHDPRLLVLLPVLASDTALKIWDSLNLGSYHFTQWNVIGKMVATNISELWNETDIVGQYINSDGQAKKLALSLKLTKKHSFTNTKSAGVKSFFIKYFPTFDSADLNSVQQILNHEVNESFLSMGHRLYEMADLNFHGTFDTKWSRQFSELPGELNPLMRQIVHANYHRVAQCLMSLLLELKERDQQKFFESLYALCGVGHKEIIQVSCFHQDYQLQKISVKSFDDLFIKANKECTLLPLKDLASSVEIILGDISLQLRVKPMNKFTTAAYKINCSIKVKS